MPKPLDIEAYHALADTCNLTYEGDKAEPNIRTPARWHCKKCGPIEMAYFLLERKGTCPICGQGRSPSKPGRKGLTPENFNDTARGAGLIWIGEGKSPGSHGPTKWQCLTNKRHKFTATYHNVNLLGKREKSIACPACRASRKKVKLEPKPTPQIDRPLKWEWFLEKYGEPWYSPVRFGPN